MKYLIFAAAFISGCTTLKSGDKRTTVERVVLGGGWVWPFTLEYDRTTEHAAPITPRK